MMASQRRAFPPKRANRSRRPRAIRLTRASTAIRPTNLVRYVMLREITDPDEPEEPHGSEAGYYYDADTLGTELSNLGYVFDSLVRMSRHEAKEDVNDDAQESWTQILQGLVSGQALS